MFDFLKNIWNSITGFVSDTFKSIKNYLNPTKPTISEIDKLYNDITNSFNVSESKFENLISKKTKISQNIAILTLSKYYAGLINRNFQSNIGTEKTSKISVINYLKDFDSDLNTVLRNMSNIYTAYNSENITTSNYDEITNMYNDQLNIYLEHFTETVEDYFERAGRRYKLKYNEKYEMELDKTSVDEYYYLETNGIEIRLKYENMLVNQQENIYYVDPEEVYLYVDDGVRAYNNFKLISHSNTIENNIKINTYKYKHMLPDHLEGGFTIIKSEDSDKIELELTFDDLKWGDTGGFKGVLKYKNMYWLKIDGTNKKLNEIPTYEAEPYKPELKYAYNSTSKKIFKYNVTTKIWDNITSSLKTVTDLNIDTLVNEDIIYYTGLSAVYYENKKYKLNHDYGTQTHNELLLSKLVNLLNSDLDVGKSFRVLNNIDNAMILITDSVIPYLELELINSMDEIKDYLLSYPISIQYFTTKNYNLLTDPDLQDLISPLMTMSQAEFPSYSSHTGLTSNAAFRETFENNLNIILHGLNIQIDRNAQALIKIDDIIDSYGSMFNTTSESASVKSESDKLEKFLGVFDGLLDPEFDYTEFSIFEGKRFRGITADVISTYETWKENLTNETSSPTTPLVFDDIPTIANLYILGELSINLITSGAIMYRDDYNNITRAINSLLVKMIKRGTLNSSSISPELKNIFDKEQELFENHRTMVNKNFNMEMIPASIKRIFRDTVIMDSIDLEPFGEELKKVDGVYELNDGMEDVLKAMDFIWIRAIFISRDININLRNIITTLVNSPKNLRTFVIEHSLKRALNNDSIKDLNKISNSTKELINNFIGDPTKIDEVYLEIYKAYGNIYRFLYADDVLDIIQLLDNSIDRDQVTGDGTLKFYLLRNRGFNLESILKDILKTLGDVLLFPFRLLYEVGVGLYKLIEWIINNVTPKGIVDALKKITLITYTEKQLADKNSNINKFLQAISDFYNGIVVPASTEVVRYINITIYSIVTGVVSLYKVVEEWFVNGWEYVVEQIKEVFNIYESELSDGMLDAYVALVKNPVKIDDTDTDRKFYPELYTYMMSEDSKFLKVEEDDPVPLIENTDLILTSRIGLKYFRNIREAKETYYILMKDFSPSNISNMNLPYLKNLSDKLFKLDDVTSLNNSYLNINSALLFEPNKKHLYLSSYNDDRLIAYTLRGNYNNISEIHFDDILKSDLLKEIVDWSLTTGEELNHDTLIDIKYVIDSALTKIIDELDIDEDDNINGKMSVELINKIIFYNDILVNMFDLEGDDIDVIEDVYAKIINDLDILRTNIISAFKYITEIDKRFELKGDLL